MAEHLFASERPITTLAEDQLGRSGFARALAKVIDQWSGHDSLVLAIYGPWGSGKSSLKNMVLDALAKSKSHAAPLEFTPWEWAAQDKVFEGFFAELSKKIGADNPSKEAAEAAKKVRMYAAMLSAAASITSHFRTVLIWSFIAVGLLGVTPLGFDSPYFHIARTVLGVLAIVAASVLAKFGDAADKVATYLAAKSDATRKGITDLKNELRLLMSKLGKTVLVVVDDLDRLTPDEIRIVFQLVKANADFPSLVYLLLFQRDTVERALSRNNEVDGAEFLSKIVQVGFDIPKISKKQLEESVESVVSHVVQGGPADKRFDTPRWGKLIGSGVMPYFQTLRDVKRFGNALSFHFELYKNGDSFDANPIDLIALEVLRQYESPLYQKLHGERMLLTGEHGSILGLPEKEKQDAENLIEGAKRPDSARNLIEDVFPPVALALSGAKTSVSAFRSEWLKDLRPCHPETFERYFRFSLSPEDLSESELSSLLALAATGDRQSIIQELKRLNGKGLLKAAVVQLRLHAASSVDANALPFITALLDMERELISQPAGSGIARVPTEMQAILIVGDVLRQRPIGLRGSLLRDAVAQSTALYLPMISFESSDEERKGAIDPLVSDEDSQLLKAACVEKIRNAKVSTELLSHPKLRYILQCWSKWGSDAEASAWVGQTSETDSGLLSLLAAFTEGMNEIVGDRAVSATYRFALEDFVRYTNVDALAERVRRLASSTNKENESRCRLFLRAFERWKSTGLMPYPQNLDNWTTLEKLQAKSSVPDAPTFAT
jgi:predicted KAP-like P-loop ATPase